MKLIERGGVWQVHFDDLTGDRQRKSTNVKVDPKLPDRGKASAMLVAADKIRQHLEDQAPEAGKKRRSALLTLAYCIDRSWESRWSKQRSAAHKRYVIDKVRRDVGYWPAADVTYSRLLGYGEELERAGDKPATRNRKMSVVHTAMTDAKRRGELDTVPDFPHYTEGNVKERYLTTDEEARLLESMGGNLAPLDHEGRYMLHMVELLVDTGLRAGETRFSEGQLIGEAPGALHLQHGTTKSGKARSVPLTRRARAAAESVLASPVHDKLRRMTADAASDWLGRRFATACRRAGIEGVTLHTLRHTCASRLATKGVDIYKIRAWLGHASTTTTERYAHLIPGALDDARAALDGGHTVPPAQPLPVGNHNPVAVTHPGATYAFQFQGLACPSVPLTWETRSNDEPEKTTT